MTSQVRSPADHTLKLLGRRTATTISGIENNGLLRRRTVAFACSLLGTCLLAGCPAASDKDDNSAREGPAGACSRYTRAWYFGSRPAPCSRVSVPPKSSRVCDVLCRMCDFSASPRPTRAGRGAAPSRSGWR